MVITVICVLSGVVMAVLYILDLIKRKRIAEENEQIRRLMVKTEPFSVSKYYERMEKASVEIMNEREKEPVYIITLWAGLDGLRMNDDGTTEWIRREEDKPKPVSVSYSPCQSIAQSVTPLSYAGCQNVASQIDQMQALQLQLNALNFQAQIAQSFRPPSYFPPAYYFPPYNPYCSQYRG